MITNYKIAAVVVTYNRLELLKKCIEAIRNQTRKVDEIIVVNNSSTDGTFEWLNTQNDLTVITQENSGSAGGQYTGIKIAYEKGYDWIWCLDTDVIANNDALEKLVETKISSENIGFLSSNIYYPDGNLANANIPELSNSYDVLNMISKYHVVPILSASFGSVLFPREVIKKVGLPSKDFFIWGDDAEFTLRIIQNGFKGFLILQSVATHYNNYNESKPYKDLKILEIKFLFGIRNMVYVNIMRNIITHNSKLRGYISALGFVVRIYKQRNGSKLNLVDFFSLTRLYIKGITFSPRIEKADE